MELTDGAWNIVKGRACHQKYVILPHSLPKISQIYSIKWHKWCHLVGILGHQLVYSCTVPKSKAKQVIFLGRDSGDLVLCLLVGGLLMINPRPLRIFTRYQCSNNIPSETHVYLEAKFTEICVVNTSASASASVVFLTQKKSEIVV